jgi:L-alanine-DL-glutamate epimerase-like enolase superfamily enzyme
MKLIFHTFNLELKDTFTINHGSRDFQPSLVVEIQDGGYYGFGEAAATSYYGVTIEKMIASIKRVESQVKENIHLSPEEVWQKTAPYFSSDPFAQCALDMAVHDLYGKKKNLPLYKLWGLDLGSFPLTNYTIGIDSVEKMVQKMKEFPWPLYKIKLGTDDDVAIVKELRKHTNAVFRVDANAAWTAREAINNSELLKDLNVEFLEQPLSKDDWEGMKEVYKHSALPVIADESCIEENDVSKCAGYFHGVNIKLTKCGGLTPAKRMIAAAKGLGMKVMVGCMTESTVGISAIAQLLPLLDYVDMDGALLLKNDIAEGVKIYDGKVVFPDRNGTGVKLING